MKDEIASPTLPNTRLLVKRINKMSALNTINVTHSVSLEKMRSLYLLLSFCFFAAKTIFLQFTIIHIITFQRKKFNGIQANFCSLYKKFYRKTQKTDFARFLQKKPVFLP